MAKKITIKRSKLLDDMDKLIEKREIEKYIDKHLVVTATCRLKVESELDNDTLYLGNLKFESIHLDDLQYFIGDNKEEISKFSIVKYAKDRLREGN